MSFVGLGRTFDGQVLPYTQEELAGAGHDCDLERCPWNVACVDYLQSGVGSKSCGPELARRYRLDAGDFRFSVGFVPEVL